MKKIAIITNPQKRKVNDILPTLLSWLEKRKIKVSINQNGKKDFKNTDLVIVLGGDGTVLKVARLVVPSGIPILGVNLGEFGFLSQVSIKDLYPALVKVLKRDYYIEERILLSGKVINSSKTGSKNNLKKNFLSLNDIVVKNATSARVIKLKVALENRQIADWIGDGLIISTPTGSTAYSLAAFGPIVYPMLPVFLLTPICPHALTFRSLVVASNEIILIQVKSKKNVMLSIDGQEEMNLFYNDIIKIKQARRKLKLVSLSKSVDFFQTLRKKLRWGKR